MPNSSAFLWQVVWRWLGERLIGLRALAHFCLASVVLDAVGMLTGFFVLRWMAPEGIGLWQSLLLVQSYCGIVQAGVLNGLNRELPYAMGAKEQNRVQVLAGTAQSVALAGAAILLLTGGVGAAILRDPRVRWGLTVVVVCTGINIYRNYLTVTYRAEKGFRALANIRFAESSMAVLTLPLVCYFQYAGLVARFALTTLFGVVLNHLYRPMRIPLQFSWKQLLLLLKVGIPIFAFGYLLSMANTFPRLILLWKGGPVLAGLFAPTVAVMGLCQMVPMSIAQYVYPQMSYILGQTGDPRSVWSIAWKTAGGILILSLPLVILGEFVLPWFVTELLPKYAASQWAIRWGLASGLFMGMSMSLNALSSLKAWRFMAVYAATYCATSFILPFLFLQTWVDPLEGVAAGYFLAQAVSFALAMYCIFQATHKVSSAREEREVPADAKTADVVPA